MSPDREQARPIDLETLERVTMRLREALTDYAKDPANLYILDSVIKRFELTYELSIRTLRRFLLDFVISAPEVEDMSLQGLIRRGDKERLLQSGWPRWKDFRDARNETVHTYREEKARQIAKTADTFIAEAEYLLQNLKRRIPGNG